MPTLSQFFGGSTTDDIESTLEQLLALITAGNAIIHVPVANNGNIEFIVIGDNYLATNSRAFEWLIDPIPGLTISAASTFGGKNIDDEDEVWLVNGTITVVDDKWKVSFDLLNTDTENLPPGTYKWSVSIEDITVIINYKECQYTELIEKQS